MDWTISSWSVGPQHSELRELAQAVIGPLKSGLHSFNNVSEMLLSVNADIIHPRCESFHDIRREIENMKEQMEESEHTAREELQRIDGETEHLTAEQTNLAKQKKQRESELDDLKTELESYISSLNTYNQALETERTNLRSAEETLDKMIQKRDEAERVRNAGIGVMFIPIWGWIAGAIMVGVGETDMNQASDAVDRAKTEIENCESQVRLYSGKVSEYNSLIDGAQCDIQEADDKIHEIEAKLRCVFVKRKVVADVQVKMRKAVHQLGLLYGVGSVAELQTRRLILLEPVMGVMEEVTTVLGQITGDELLYTEGIKSLMWDMKMNHNKLKQLADTNNCVDDDFY